jgi:NAD(P)-dependent dehydrogenase (short-subunit alcohol dehydrogenase family)
MFVSRTAAELEEAVAEAGEGAAARAFLACRGFGDRLLAAGRAGSIVTLSSQMGSVGYPGRVAYCATKHAVDGMSRALAVE